MPPILARGLQVRPPTLSAGSSGVEVLTASEIRRRLDAYLASPELTAAEREVAQDYLDSPPEVARADGASPGPEAVSRRAKQVLRLHARTAALVPTASVGMAQLRAAAEALARDVCSLLGADPDSVGG